MDKCSDQTVPFLPDGQFKNDDITKILQKNQFRTLEQNEKRQIDKKTTGKNVKKQEIASSFLLTTRKKCNQTVLMVGDVACFTPLTNKLEKNNVTVISMYKFRHTLASLFMLDIGCIVTSITEFERTLQSIRDNHILSELLIPIVVVGKENGITKAVCYLSGADDYIHENTDLTEVLIRVIRQLERTAQLNERIFIDELTKAYSRNYLVPAYTQMINKMFTLEQSLCIALIDLDNFKQINDKYSYLTGDKVLISFVKQVHKHIRKDDVIVRFGGEEFLILFPNACLKETTKIIQNILNSFSAITFTHEEENFTSTFSAGIIEADLNRDLPGNLQHVNKLLSSAKAKGRNNINVASSRKSK